METTLTPFTVNRVLLKNISWKTYQSLVEEMESQSATRLTYDNGQLEIMTPLNSHENYKKLLGRFVEAATEELEIDILGLGSSTWSREDLAKGLEPDQCYYIQNERLVRELDSIDLNQYPPPDLAIEVDITSSSINRLSLYAALGVPEVWRYDGVNLTIYGLEKGEYKVRDKSVALPIITPAEVVRFLNSRKAMGETKLIRAFRQWVRSQIE